MSYFKWLFKESLLDQERPMRVDDVTVCDTWDSSNSDWDKRGGFNFSTEEGILRWVSRGDVLCEVELPEDAEKMSVENSKTPNGIIVANKIILRNPIPLSDELTMELYHKSNMPLKTYFETIAALAIRGCYKTCLQIIRDKVTMDNIDMALYEYEDFLKPWHIDSHMDREVYDQVFQLLKEIKSDVLINQFIDKEPYIKEISEDKIINVTGQSGAGKSTYILNHFNADDYFIVDTDDIFSEDRFSKSTGINRELGEYFRSKYKVLPNCGDDFDLIYQEIVEYCKKYDKTLVVDCAQFHCIKDLFLLKGKIIVLRTCIDECYRRTIERYQKIHPDCTEEELNHYKEKKKAIYQWYKYSNQFLNQLDEFENTKEKESIK